MTQQPEPDDHSQPEQPDVQAQPGEGARDGAPPAGSAEQASADTTDLGQLETQLAERTADLQRLQAEYVNYKRRVDRDRGVVRDNATATVLTALLPVLDDIDRARMHGELTGGFKAVAESLERTVTGLGLVRFGEPGEPFDPQVHEALMHELSDDVDGPTAQTILQPGYRIAERIVRPARVAVVEPLTTASGVTVDEAEAPSGPGPVDADVAGPDVVDDAPLDDGGADDGRADDADDGSAGDVVEGRASRDESSRT